VSDVAQCNPNYIHTRVETRVHTHTRKYTHIYLYIYIYIYVHTCRQIPQHDWGGELHFVPQLRPGEIRTIWRIYLYRLRKGVLFAWRFLYVVLHLSANILNICAIYYTGHLNVYARIRTHTDRSSTECNQKMASGATSLQSNLSLSLSVYIYIYIYIHIYMHLHIT
jgi:hypothetical protein